MAELKKNYRTIIMRGDEIRKEEIDKLTGIYAVSTLRKGEGGFPEWGIVAFHGTDPVQSFNVSMKYRWSDGLISIEGLHFFMPTAMEVKFVHEHYQMKNMTASAKRYLAKLKIYEDDRWHRVAERIRKWLE